MMDKYDIKYNQTHRQDRLSKGSKGLIVNGKAINVQKRPFQGFCELCSNPIESNPRWHHWDDEHPEKGMWLDIFCHGAAEAHEQNGVEVPLYQELKERINKMS